MLSLLCLTAAPFDRPLGKSTGPLDVKQSSDKARLPGSVFSHAWLGVPLSTRRISAKAADLICRPCHSPARRPDSTARTAAWVLSETPSLLMMRCT